MLCSLPTTDQIGPGFCLCPQAPLRSRLRSRYRLNSLSQPGAFTFADASCEVPSRGSQTWLRIDSFSPSYYTGAIMLSNLRFRVGPLGRIKRGAQEFQGTSRRAVNFLPGQNLSPKSRVNLALSNKQPILPPLLIMEKPPTSRAIQMFWIRGFRQRFGHFQPWVGPKKPLS